MATSTSLSPPYLFLSPQRSLFLSPKFPSFSLFNRTPSISSSLFFSGRLLSRVSTVPVEQAPSPEPEEEVDFSGEVARLDSLRAKLKQARDLDEEVRVLDSDARVREFLRGKPRVLEGLGKEDVSLVKKVVAAGQAHVIGEVAHVIKEEKHVRSGLRSAMYVLGDMVDGWSLDGSDGRERKEKARVGELSMFLKILGEIEEFYNCIGGIIGYQIMVLGLLSPPKVDKQSGLSPYLNDALERQFMGFHVPKGHNLIEDTEYASQVALWGIEGLPELGEIYPLGGAGDRLGLVDTETGECLPAAMLPFFGRTLLEGLIRDLQPQDMINESPFH